MSKYNFDAPRETNRIIDWTRDWFKENSPNGTAVIGISGGKDSTVVAAILSQAIGADRVLGVLMPDGVQPDIEDSRTVIKHLGIQAMQVNIQEAKLGVYSGIENAINPITGEKLNLAIKANTRINTPPRIRMTTLYGIAQSLATGGMVANTCNLSEDYIGYSTKFGDSAGDFAPLGDYTVTEVLAIGEVLKLPRHLIYKTPSDGLCGLSDEDKIGFTYAVLDKYIRTGICEDKATLIRIEKLYKANLHKQKPMPKCVYLPDAA